MIEFSNIELIIYSGVFGLLIGSFISMLTWRLPRIMDLEADQQLKQISTSRSYCPSCKTNLNWQQLFPVLSWIMAKARCKNCNAKISIRYPLIEILTMLLTIYIAMVFGFTLTGFFALVFSYFLMTIVVIDIEHQLILDKLSLPLMWLGLLFSLEGSFTTPEESIIGAASGYMLLWVIYYAFKIITGKEGMGFGDFKLLAALGAWFGLSALPQIILIASISSIIVAIILALIKFKDINSAQPFGPFLAIAGLVTLTLGIIF